MEGTVRGVYNVGELLRLQVKVRGCCSVGFYRHTETMVSGDYGVGEMRSVFRSCSVRRLQFVGLAVFEIGGVWQLLYREVEMCASCGVREGRCDRAGGGAAVWESCS